MPAVDSAPGYWTSGTSEKLRREGDAFGGLRELLGEGDGRGYTRRELNRIGDLYANMRAASGPPHRLAR